jgi:hypothetical protein
MGSAAAHHAGRGFLRSVLWISIVACAVLGFFGAWGRGPGLLIGAVLIAMYDGQRHERVSSIGYAMLIAGLVVVVTLWWFVPLR